MEILSEHTCQGWLEGYLLTGRHGLLVVLRGVHHIVDSMVNQHAKWLKSARAIAWRRPIASLNYLLTSHVWRQDHNGFSHQDPGFIDHVVNKKADIVRGVSATRRHYAAVGDRPLPAQLGPHQRDRRRQAAGAAVGWIWKQRSSTAPRASASGRSPPTTRAPSPTWVMACAGDVPTLEVMAAVDLLHGLLPELRIRVVNVVDLMTLQPKSQHPHRAVGSGIRCAVHHQRPG